jgi:hypothetical protein
VLNEKTGTNKSPITNVDEITVRNLFIKINFRGE